MSDYRRALVDPTLTTSDQRLLLVHYAFPSHRATPRQLAHYLGYVGYGGANLSYGKLGRRLRRLLPRNPRDWRRGYSNWWGILAKGDHEEPEWAWRLRPELVQALRLIPWFTSISVTTEGLDLSPDETNKSAYREGRAVLATVSLYERSRPARLACIAQYGHACTVCGSSLEDLYGQVARGLVHVHHLKPLSSIGRAYVLNPVRDLRPLCPNCHAVAHYSSRPLTIAQLRRAYNKANRAPA